MLADGRIRITGLSAVSLMLALGAISLPAAAQCVDHSSDPAGCQPSTFRTPLEQMPSGRVNRQGKTDPTASEADVRAGAALLATTLHLFRNVEQLHWVPLTPSVKDPATGSWKDGDLDGAGDGRGFAVAGNCIFVGHNTSPPRAMTILKIQPNPEKQPPVPVGEIPTPTGLDTRRGIDDKELRALVYEISPGQDRMILVRLVEDRVEWHRIDVNVQGSRIRSARG